MNKTKPSSFPLSSAEIVANSKDLLTEILVRIPLKPVLRLKLISKQWLSVISSVEFSGSYARHHQNHGLLTPTALYMDDNIHDYERPFEIPLVALNPQTKVPILDFVDDPFFRILQSCNGLLLGCFYKGNKESRYFVCNPITRKFKKINISVPFRQGCLYAVNLAFDPIKSPYYKIIYVRESDSRSNSFVIHIYSSESDEWDDSCISFEATREIRFEEGVFCNGIIHWNSDGEESLRFDLEKKEVMKMPMLARMFQAPEWSMSEDSRCFGESRGYLHLGVAYVPCFKFNVFEMATDYSHWFLKYCLNLYDGSNHFPELSLSSIIMYTRSRSRILSVIRSEGGESKIVIFVDYKVVCCELKDEILLKVYELEPSPGTFHLHPYYDTGTGIQVYHYFETLSCVSGSNF